MVIMRERLSNFRENHNDDHYDKELEMRTGEYEKKSKENRK